MMPPLKYNQDRSISIDEKVGSGKGIVTQPDDKTATNEFRHRYFGYTLFR